MKGTAPSPPTTCGMIPFHFSIARICRTEAPACRSASDSMRMASAFAIASIRMASATPFAWAIRCLRFSLTLADCFLRFVSALSRFDHRVDAGLDPGVDSRLSYHVHILDGDLCTEFLAHKPHDGIV